MKKPDKLDQINRKLGALERIEDRLEKVVDREQGELKRIEKEEALLEKDEARIERRVVAIGNFTVKRSHLLELARGVAGAFLGVGLGQALGGAVTLAERLHWLNIIGILVFVIVVVSVLVYRNDKQMIADNHLNPIRYVVRTVAVLYVTSLSVQLLALGLFNNFPGWNILLVKALIVGSFPAMSSAAAFTIL